MKKYPIINRILALALASALAASSPVSVFADDNTATVEAAAEEGTEASSETAAEAETTESTAVVDETTTEAESAAKSDEQSTESETKADGAAESDTVIPDEKTPTSGDAAKADETTEKTEKADKDAKAECAHVDEDKDGICDLCKEAMPETEEKSTECKEHVDENKDCVCDVCGEKIECVDEDGDGVCDVCGKEVEKKDDDLTLTYEDDDVVITVSGAVPDNSDLSVKPITTGDAYNNVETQLNKDAKDNNYKLYGFVAYDISFVNHETGEETEPSEDVKVSFQYKNGYVPEAAADKDDVSVSVLHLADKVENLTEAGKAVVATTESNAISTASFESDSFSPYVLTWTNGNEVTVYLKYYSFGTTSETAAVDITEMADSLTDEEIKDAITTDGKGNNPEVTIQQNDIKISGIRDNIDLKAFAKKIDGYTFDRIVASTTNPENGNARSEFYNNQKSLNNVDGLRIGANEQNKVSVSGIRSGIETGNLTKRSQDIYVVFVYEPAAGQAGSPLVNRGDSSDLTVNLFDYTVNNKFQEEDELDVGINSGKALKFSLGKVNTDMYGLFNQWVANISDSNYGKVTYKARAYTDIVKSELDNNGYPVLKTDASSLDYLFNENESANKKSLTGVTGLFAKDSNGYYTFDSTTTYATVSGDYVNGNSFKVYQSNTNSTGFFPFTSYTLRDTDSGDDNADTANGDTLGSQFINHWFGMSVSANIVQPKDGKIGNDDMVFEFSGDDDLWVFIDGKLVLDVGGIHGACEGKIDFANKKVTVYKYTDQNGALASNNGKKEQYTKTFDQLGLTMDDNTSHSFELFYLERGNGASNCKIKTNIQTLQKGTLNVSKTANYPKQISADDKNNIDYEFQLVKNGSDDAADAGVANKEYTILGTSQTGTTDNEGKFVLKSGQTAVFADLEDATYTVNETKTVAVEDSEVDVNDKYALSKYATTITSGTTTITVPAGTEDCRSASVTMGGSNTDAKFVGFTNNYSVKTTDDTPSEITKKVTDNEDGSYGLTLDFKAPYQKVTDTTPEASSQKLDFVLVLDKSGSMNDSYTGQGKTKRYEIAETAIDTLVSTVTKNKSIDAKWKIVTFATTASIYTSDWIESNDVSTKVNSAFGTPNGGTNYEDGLLKAQSVLKTARTDAKKVVIFLTDGQPTYNNNNMVWGGTETYHSDYYNALDQASKITADYFYAVGISLSNVEVKSDYWPNGTEETISGLQLLKNICDKTVCSNSDAYNDTDGKLTEIFAEIAETVKDQTSDYTNYASNATIIDTLSDYAEVTENATYTITVKKDGQDVTPIETKIDGNVGENDSTAKFKLSSDVELTAKYYDEKTSLEDGTEIPAKSFVLNIPGQMSDDYTYAITVNSIQPTDEAYNKYAENGNSYDKDNEGNVIKGDEGTGDSSAGEEGFRCNTTATVNYTYLDKKVTETYKHPVIQLNNRSYFALKKISASDNTSGLAGAEFKMTLLDEKSSATDTVYYGLSSVDDENNKGLVTWYRDENHNTKLEGQIPDGKYTLVETAAPEGYSKSDDTWTVTINSKAATDAIIVTCNTSGHTHTGTVSGDDKNKIYTFSFEDEICYTLPETGGRGIYLYTISGMLLLIASSLLLYNAKKRNNII